MACNKNLEPCATLIVGMHLSYWLRGPILSLARASVLTFIQVEDCIHCKSRISSLLEATA